MKETYDPVNPATHCGADGTWTIFDKNTCKRTTVCDACISKVFVHTGHVYVVYGAYDYSKHPENER